MAAWVEMFFCAGGEFFVTVLGMQSCLSAAQCVLGLCTLFTCPIGTSLEALSSDSTNILEYR